MQSGKLDRWLNIGTLAAVLALAALTWPINRAILDNPDAPVPSGVVLEWNVNRPNLEPVRITLDLHVGESREKWQLRLREAFERLEDIR